jgi:hypothetical protein
MAIGFATMRLSRDTAGAIAYAKKIAAIRIATNV